MTTTDSPESSTEKAKQLPDPATFHILCATMTVTEKYDSGIIKADGTRAAEEVLSPILFVMKVGPDAFKDPARFPSGAACKEGDFIVVRPNSGTRIKIHGKEFRIINDDTVEAVVQDPRGVSRI